MQLDKKETWSLLIAEKIKIGKEFDKRGIEIFHNDIQSLILEYVSDFDNMKVND